MSESQPDENVLFQDKFKFKGIIGQG
jgi:hypothetical protein